MLLLLLRGRLGHLHLHHRAQLWIGWRRHLLRIVRVGGAVVWTDEVQLVRLMRRGRRRVGGCRVMRMMRVMRMRVRVVTVVRRVAGE